MMHITLHLIFFLFQMYSVTGDDDHRSSLQPLVFPSTTSKTPNTIPAFPEQSDVMTTDCPLTLPSELFNAISQSCSSPISHSRCCPTLSAWLFSAYYTPSSLLPPPPSTADLPVLPDDTETCVGEVKKAMRGRGVFLGEVNETCDLVSCYCGVRLRPLSCLGGEGVKFEMTKEGKVVAVDEKAKRVEKECTGRSCSKCLRSLYQFKEGPAVGVKNKTNTGDQQQHHRDCELTALSWLLAKNRTLYLPTAIKVLRTFMLAPDGHYPLSCKLTGVGLPLAVDTSSSSIGSLFPSPYLSWIVHFLSVLLPVFASIV